MYVHFPSLVTTTLVGYVPSKASSALILDEDTVYYMYSEWHHAINQPTCCTWEHQVSRVWMVVLLCLRCFHILTCSTSCWYRSIPKQIPYVSSQFWNFKLFKHSWAEKCIPIIVMSDSPWKVHATCFSTFISDQHALISRMFGGIYWL